MDVSIKSNVTVTENGHFSICQLPFCQWLSVSNDAINGGFTATIDLHFCVVWTYRNSSAPELLDYIAVINAPSGGQFQKKH